MNICCEVLENKFSSLSVHAKVFKIFGLPFKNKNKNKASARFFEYTS